MKKRSIIPSAIGSVLFASAITMLIPTLASATFQDVSSPPHASQATQPATKRPSAMPTAKHLSAQQMKATKGAFGMICSGDCNSGTGGCSFTSTYGGCYCTSNYYHHPVCVTSYNPTVYSNCTNSANLDCYDYVYYRNGCAGAAGSGPYITTVTHFTPCCGS